MSKYKIDDGIAIPAVFGACRKGRQLKKRAIEYFLQLAYERIADLLQRNEELLKSNCEIRQRAQMDEDMLASTLAIIPKTSCMGIEIERVLNERGRMTIRAFGE
jgi:hypothetical protein